MSETTMQAPIEEAIPAFAMEVEQPEKQDLLPTAMNPLTGEEIDLTNPDEVVESWRDIKDQIRLLVDVQDELERVILAMAPFQGDAKTTRLEASTATLKLTKGTRLVYDKKVLEEASENLQAEIRDTIMERQESYKIKAAPMKKFLASCHTDPQTEAMRLKILETRTEVENKTRIEVEKVKLHQRMKEELER